MSESGETNQFNFFYYRRTRKSFKLILYSNRPTALDLTQFDSLELRIYQDRNDTTPDKIYIPTNGGDYNDFAEGKVRIIFDDIDLKDDGFYELLGINNGQTPISILFGLLYNQPITNVKPRT
jgi:hypothetical protein